jgi:retron-type reverse transcriptase
VGSGTGYQVAASFDAIDHEWLAKFIEHRIADRGVARLIRKWLRADVSEDGRWSASQVGTPQGAVESPLLANVYLHYVFDLWMQRWRQRNAKGDDIVVRHAADFVLGILHRHEAERFLSDLHGRLKGAVANRKSSGAVQAATASTPGRVRPTL